MGSVRLVLQARYLFTDLERISCGMVGCGRLAYSCMMPSHIFCLRNAALERGPSGVRGEPCARFSKLLSSVAPCEQLLGDNSLRPSALYLAWFSAPSLNFITMLSSISCFDH